MSSELTAVPLKFLKQAKKQDLDRLRCQSRQSRMDEIKECKEEEDETETEIDPDVDLEEGYRNRRIESMSK